VTGVGAVTERRLQALPRGWLIIGATLPLVLLLSWGAFLTMRSTQGTVGGSIGQQAPDFALADLDGNPVRLADLRGKAVVLNFWASWCGPCVEEFPLLRDAAERHGADQVAVVGIVYRDSSEAARGFMARFGATWQSAMDPGEAVAREYAIFGPPETFFIDRSGVVRGRQIGQLSGPDLERQLTLALANAPRSEEHTSELQSHA